LAFVDGPRYNILPFLGADYFIVILYVPILLLTHMMVFKLLYKHSRAGYPLFTEKFLKSWWQ
jgi:hypothetical protein